MTPLASRFFLHNLKNFVAAGSLVIAAAQAQAQGRFCLGGDLEHLAASQRSACAAKLSAVRTAAQRFGAPNDWHFVIVCGEEGWKAYAPFSTRTAAELAQAAADTDLLARSTYLREAKLNGLGSDQLPERALAREIAAVVLQTSDPAIIEARVDLWMTQASRDASQSTPVLRASR